MSRNYRLNWFIILKMADFVFMLSLFLINCILIIISIIIIFFLLLLVLNRWWLTIRFCLCLRPSKLIDKSFFLNHFVVVYKIIIWIWYLSKNLRSIFTFFDSFWLLFFRIAVIRFSLWIFLIVFSRLDLLINFFKL